MANLPEVKKLSLTQLVFALFLSLLKEQRSPSELNSLIYLLILLTDMLYSMRDL